MPTPLPPGPRLPRVVQTLLYSQCRNWYLTRTARRYGDVFTLRLVEPFSANVVVFSRPEHIREIFAAEPTDLHAGQGNRLLGPVMGEHSLLLTDEAEHARARRLLMPAFTGAALHGYRCLVEAIAKAHIETWAAGAIVPTHERMNELTLDVIMQVVFGVTEQRGRDELAPALRRIVTLNPLVFFGWKYPRLERVGMWKRFRRSQIALDELLYREIAERRRSELDSHADVLSRLLAVGSGEDPADGDGRPAGWVGTAPLTDAELRDQLITLLLAGHETTAAALSWALHELAVHPEVQASARRAAADGDDKYLEAVLKEAMRRRTVIGGTARRLTRDRSIAGIELPRDTVVSTSIVLAHQRPDNFADATAFRPERFLDGSVAPNTWLPFGGGVRRCIGAGFSLMEGTAVLREVLSRFALALPAGTTGERGRMRNITHVPAHGAPILVTADGISAGEPAVR